MRYKYFDLLKLQYYSAVGKKIKNYLKGDNIVEISDFLFERQLLGEKYVRYLKYLGIDITMKETAEVGKGSYDTITNGFETTLISPYFEDLEDSRLLNYELLTLNVSPALFKFGEKRRIEEITRIPQYINTFMTQNPYKKNEILNWNRVYQDGYDIIVGMYGLNSDKDKEKKLAILKKIRDTISTSLEINYERDYSDYLAVLTTLATKQKNHKVKIR